MANRAVFLDRDGTINVATGYYVFRPEDFRLVAGAADGIRTLNASGFKVVVVTNQSGVAYGEYEELQVERLHEHVKTMLDSMSARVDGFYYCPHHPEAPIARYRVTCSCRKPEPGMLRRAAHELDLDLMESWMIGDQPTDIAAGLAAGCRAILLQAGGDPERKESEVVVMRDLFQAAVHVVNADARR